MATNVIKCNKCALHKCTIYNENIDSSRCTSFTELDTFKQPMLIHLLTNAKPQPVSELLGRVRLRLKEHHKYPYFKLVLDKS